MSCLSTASPVSARWLAAEVFTCRVNCYSSHGTINGFSYLVNSSGHVRCYHCQERFRPNLCSSMVCASVIPLWNPK